jgi:uncharacterized membrane protein
MGDSMTAADRLPTKDQERRATLVFVALMVAFALVMGTLSLVRYASLHSDIDLGLYSQVVWNTAHGDWFRNSVLPFTENYLGNHFTPILILFAPLYRLWPDARLLLLVQVIVSALGAWPLFLLAREKLPGVWPAVFLSAAYLLYPAVHHQNLADFHGIALGTSVVMWAFYALLTRRDRLLFATLILMTLIREDLPLLIIMMGIHAFLIQRRRRFGLVLLSAGVVTSALIILVLIPSFREGMSFHYYEYYDYLGSSPLEILRTVVLQPKVWLSRVLHPPKLLLFVQLLLPVAFLPLLAPSVFILGGSAIAYVYLVDLPFYVIYHLETQNQALFIPFILAGTVLGLANLVRWAGPRWGGLRVADAGGAIVVLASITALVFWGPLSDETKRAQFQLDDQSRAEWSLLEQVPPEAGIVADDRFAAALSTREGFYVFGGRFEHDHSLDYLIYEDTPVGYPAHPPALLRAPSEQGWLVPRYDLVGSAGLTQLRQCTGEILAQALEPAPVFGDAVALRAATGSVGGLAAEPGQELEVALVWESRAPELPRLVPFLHLVERRTARLPSPGPSSPGATDGDAEYRWASIDHEPYGGLFPTSKWAAGTVVGDIYALEIPSWMPPGSYQVRAGLYTRDGQQRLVLPDGATTALVASIDVAPPKPAADTAPAGIPIVTQSSLAPGLELYGQTPVLERAAPGAELDFALFWHATDPMTRLYSAKLDLTAEGTTVAAATWTQPLVQVRFPNTEWQPGTIVADWVHLALPADLATGVYRLEVTAVDEDGQAGVPVGVAIINIEG